MMRYQRLKQIRNRQLARLLTHLHQTGQLTPSLEVDIKRAYRYIFEDVEKLFADTDKTRREEMSTNDDRQKWLEYERAKKELAGRNTTPQEYEREIRRIIDRLGV